MGLERLVVPIEWKATDDDQTLEGYASTFGNVDRGGDVVVKGAFVKTIANINSNGIPLLADHVASTASVLGTIYHAKEDEHGLRIKARFSKAPSAQDVRTKLLEGHLNKMSIGYESLDDAYEDREGRRVRLLKEIKLWETSVVVFPMNPEAAISRVKSMVEQLDPADRKNLVDDLRAPDETKATANELREALSKALREHHKGTREWAYLRDYDATKVWYELYSGGDGSKVFERPYAVDEKVQVTLDQSSTEVRAVTTYVPVDGAKDATTIVAGMDQKHTTTAPPVTTDSPVDEAEAKASGPDAAPSDEPGETPDEGVTGWDRYRSQAVMNGRDPDAKVEPAKRAGMATQLELIEADVQRSRDLLSTSALQVYTEPTE